MGPLIGQMMAPGLFEAAVGLAPSAKGLWLNFGKRTAIDGPFAESIGDVEIDIRPLYHSSI